MDKQKEKAVLEIYNNNISVYNKINIGVHKQEDLRKFCENVHGFCSYMLGSMPEYWRNCFVLIAEGLEKNTLNFHCDPLKQFYNNNRNTILEELRKSKRIQAQIAAGL